MSNQNVQNRAPKSVAQALADESANDKIAHIVAEVAAGDAARSIIVREEHPARPQAAPSDQDEDEEAQTPAREPDARDGMVQVRNGHVSGVLGVAPGEWAYVTPEQAQRYSWAWR